MKRQLSSLMKTSVSSSLHFITLPINPNKWILPSINQQKVTSKRIITYGILDGLLNSLTKVKIQQVLKFH